ncbi:GNAT family N-acetyltransferase [Desulfitobacterium metallireducens]|uniref:N-acetyltransferase domain-containing protein n=1 Tax=Desulfitobacterium metallireducens DSM 15288 TaxID=871968 RepID=W0EC30_9FIRM|nr:GNAT family N-acetyltransferase [Desulfitobacterium metallireducens]AHF08430.1 hypothetical protein DESME_02605 [Desulfitobacterium metallireducens DSM 15288]
MELTIYPISKELTDDFLYFFDKVAFTDNKEWAGCYCRFYHLNDDELKRQTGKSNRLSAIKSIQQDKMKGYLAYLDGEPVGWCNVNDKNNYSRLLLNKELWDGAEEKICSIVCFVISPEYRRKGVASQILNVICNDYSNKGYKYIEAYPKKGELTSAQHYNGPLSMYIKAGFSLYKTFSHYDIVRKAL